MLLTCVQLQSSVASLNMLRDAGSERQSVVGVAVKVTYNKQSNHSARSVHLLEELSDEDTDYDYDLHTISDTRRPQPYSIIDVDGKSLQFERDTGASLTIIGMNISKVLATVLTDAL